MPRRARSWRARPAARSPSPRPLPSPVDLPRDDRGAARRNAAPSQVDDDGLRTDLMRTLTHHSPFRERGGGQTALEEQMARATVAVLVHEMRVALGAALLASPGALPPPGAR